MCSAKNVVQYEIKNIKRGNKANAAYKGQPDRTHILFAQVFADDRMIITADYDYCVNQVKELIRLDYEADIMEAMAELGS